MRCQCCNRLLSDFEATRRHAETNEFLDICDSCFHVVNEDIEVPVLERQDLLYQNNNIEEDFDLDDQISIDNFDKY